MLFTESWHFKYVFVCEAGWFKQKLDLRYKSGASVRGNTVLLCAECRCLGSSVLNFSSRFRENSLNLHSLILLVMMVWIKDGTLAQLL